MTLPRMQVRFEPSGVTIALAPGERLLDAADDHAENAAGVAPLLPLACRAGNCGACLLSVRAGAALFTPAAPAEQVVLRELGATAEQRLGCQLRAGDDLTGPRAMSAVVDVVRR